MSVFDKNKNSLTKFVSLPQGTWQIRSERTVAQQIQPEFGNSKEVSSHPRDSTWEPWIASLSTGLSKNDGARDDQIPWTHSAKNPGQQIHILNECGKIELNSVRFVICLMEKLFQLAEENSKHEQINEMVELMRKAASIDEDKEFAEMELINKLFIENQGLREMLRISKEFGSQMPEVETDEPSAQNECNDKIENSTIE